MRPHWYNIAALAAAVIALALITRKFFRMDEVPHTRFPSKYDIPAVELITIYIDYPGIAERGIKEAARIFGKATASVTEKVLRLETGHFKSGGWKKTLGAGMHPFSKTFPYGWGSLQNFWNQNPDFKPIGIRNLREGGTGKEVTYLVFDGIGGIMTLAKAMQLRGNNGGSWYSNDPALQAGYNNTLQGIQTHYV